MKKLLYQPIMITLMLLSDACTQSPSDEQTRYDSVSNHGKKCMTCSAPAGGDYCGTRSPAGCWCDDLCKQYNDCCPDKEEICPGPTPTPSPTPDPDPNSCVGYCGEQAPGGCWCDVRCEECYDCCEDKFEICPNEVPTPTPTPTPYPPQDCGDPEIIAGYYECKLAKDKSSCIAAGGAWKNVGTIFPYVTCACPTGQGNCPCMTHSECLGACAVESDHACSDLPHGYCIPETPFFGCHCWFDESGVYYLCSDPPPTPGPPTPPPPEPPMPMPTPPGIDQPRILKEIDRSPAYFNEPVVLHKHVFFELYDQTNGHEIWKSDGTEAGTNIFKDISPSINSVHAGKFLVANQKLFFRAHSDSYGTELWMSNGTKNGTMMVKDITVGPKSTSFSLLMACNDQVFFIADDGVHGSELWKSDGTEEGTVMVKDIWPGENSAFAKIQHAATRGEQIFFFADDGTHGYEPWKSDGTQAGTTMVKDIRPGGKDSSSLYREDVIFSFKDHIYFYAYNEAHGGELWKSDGTETGTDILKELQPGNLSMLFAKYGPYLIHDDFVYLALDRGATGHELWKTDGSRAGTVMVKEFDKTGACQSHPILKAASKYQVFFAGCDNFGYELWKSDGTQAGTLMVKDIKKGAGDSSFSGSTVYTVINEKLYFFADDGLYGGELWMSDGTESGTLAVKDIYPGRKSSQVSTLIKLKNKLIFWACHPRFGIEPWVMETK